MLNPIDTDAVIRDGGAVGRFPGEIHEGVAWWLGACFVVVRNAQRLAVGHDGHPTSAEFVRRFSHGAVNAHHYACTVSLLGHVTEKTLLAFVQVVQPIAGAYLSTQTAPDGTQTVRIQLYDEHGHALQEDTGLARIRSMIAEDRVPIPVSSSARGTIQNLEVTRKEAAE